MTTNKYTIYGSWRTYNNTRTAVIEKYGESELDKVVGNAITTMFETIHEKVVKTDHDDSTMAIDTDYIVDTLLDYIFYNDEELRDEVVERKWEEKKQFYNSLHDRQEKLRKERK